MPKGDWRVARTSALQDIVYGEFLQRKDVRLLVRGGARGRGREGGMRGGARLLHRVVTDGFRRRKSRIPARNFSSTVATPVRDPEGEGRGGLWPQ
jgi:hypothetical protein